MLGASHRFLEWNVISLKALKIIFYILVFSSFLSFSFGAYWWKHYPFANSFLAVGFYKEWTVTIVSVLLKMLSFQSCRPQYDCKEGRKGKQHPLTQTVSPLEDLSFETIM